MVGKIGVLALQGGFSKHMERLRQIGVDVLEVRTARELECCDGLILPGGESTAIGSLNDLPLTSFGRPLFGTCAGMILLARLGLLSVTVARNAYGRQAHSFVAPITAHLDAEPYLFRALFIRAPRITEIHSPEVIILAQLSESDPSPIALRQGLCLATTFHPELTEDTHFHRYFVQLCESACSVRSLF